MSEQVRARPVPARRPTATRGKWSHGWRRWVKWLAALGAGSIALFLAAYWLFDRLRDSLAETV